MATTVQITRNLSITGVMNTTDGLNYAVATRSITTGDSATSGATKIDQIIDAASRLNVHTLAAGATLTINLLTGTDNPVGANAVFARVKSLFIEHSAASLASGVTAFDAASDAFQGPLVTGATMDLLPGEFIDLCSPTTVGWVVDATHKNLAIVNNDIVNAATLRFYIDGVST